MMFKKEDLDLIELTLEKYKKTRFKKYGQKTISHALKEVRKLQRLKVYSE